MRRTKTLRTAIFAVFSMAIATFATQPAQAESGMAWGYKYVSVHSIEYDANVVQVDIMWTILKGEGYRDGGKRPHDAISVGMAIGGNEGGVYWAVPVVYKHVFSNGFGVSAGVSVPLMDDEGGEEFGIGIGFSDLGVSYAFNNGLNLYANTNIGYVTFGAGGAMWGVGGGIGKWF